LLFIPSKSNPQAEIIIPGASINWMICTIEDISGIIL